MSSRVAVFCEDKYGEPFLKELAARLKNEGLMKRSKGMDAHMFYKPCNSKLSHQLRTLSLNPISQFIILVDCDGHNTEEIKTRVQHHIPCNLRNKTQIILFDYEIEDWLCVGLGESVNEKTYEKMKKKFNYEKHQLPDFVSRLDIDKLKLYPSFVKFLKYLA